MTKGSASRRKKSVESGPSLRFSKANLWCALAGLAVISLGYYLLSQGSITWAPVLLVVGYVALLPAAIIA